MLSFGPAKILILLAVALIVLGPEKLPQMSRQVGKAWGDFRRFREHLEGEVRGALGEDLMQSYTPPWQVDSSSGSAAATGTDTAVPADGAVAGGPPPADGSAAGHGAEDAASPPAPGQLAPLPPTTGPSSPGRHGWDPGLAPDDPSLN